MTLLPFVSAGTADVTAGTADVTAGTADVTAGTADVTAGTASDIWSVGPVTSGKTPGLERLATLFAGRVAPDREPNPCRSRRRRRRSGLDQSELRVEVVGGGEETPFPTNATGWSICDPTKAAPR